LKGPGGAVLATVGIFLPAFVLVAASGSYIPRLRKSRPAAAFLDGVNAASLALMAVVTVQLGASSVVDATTAAIAAGSVFLLLIFRMNSIWLIGLGGLLGYLKGL
jgi:chromate transporter